MWVAIAREPRPDSEYWPGREVLAALDAIAWPVAWVYVLAHLPVPLGLVGPFFSTVAILLGLNRLHRALWINHRYRFTTWAVAKFLGLLMVTGWILKAAMLWTAH
ncbi:hypothetical protein LNV09_07440 [Paucibacter sp. B2R-40]|uniref:hypothetical protein n=1 Tax=Paucibacter sp. B2R-40 TaxID=2893554 RepID=UPI0021E42EBC|nr:hypothetical protein [Paucibacter sp. B2R-40]MCV2353999.1 hypothetical protein [Paucibacter sp. B2R-40]